MDYKVLLADDHALMRKGLRLLLDQEADLQVVGEAENGETAIQRTQELAPDIVIMDISMPGLNGIEATRQILAARPDTRILALSIHGEKEFVDDMLAAGTAGYLLKESAPEELIAAIRKVLDGEIYLSPAITEVVVSGYRQALAGEKAFADGQDHTAASPIMLTKLHRPQVAANWIPRPRLIELLEAGRHRPLTLISAPAGYGKSILASQWLETTGCLSGWVSLDERDDDLPNFTAYLLAAVKTAFPDISLQSQALLETPTMPPAPLLARHLLNDFDQIQEPFILALDDVHVIQEQAIIDLLTELLKHPPRTTHLLLIGRQDPPIPVASLRAKSLITEVRTRDLRFRPPETAELLGLVLQREIDEGVADEWTRQTEGWATALHLVTLSLSSRKEMADLGTTVQGDSHYLQEYLLAEVLAGIPSDKQTWLLETSLLDRFCDPLCEAVCQEEGERLTGQEFVSWLQASNLFVVPLDDRGDWFRFHHLFQQLLQDRLAKHLAPHEIAAAHQRASNWFSANGLIEEALRHSLAGGDVQNAVHLVEEHRHDLMDRGRWHDLERWLNLLPPEAVAQNPLLLCATAFWAIRSAAFNVIVSSVRRAQQLVANLDPGYAQREIAQAEIVVIQSLVGLVEPQQAETPERCWRALGVLPRKALRIRSDAIMTIVLSQQMLGDMKGAVATIRETLAQQPWPDAYRARMMHYLCLAHTQEGDLPGILSAAPIGLKIAEQPLAPEPLNWCRYDLGLAHYLRSEFEQAEPYLLALLKDRYIAPVANVTHGGFLLALLYLCQDRNTEAAQIIDCLEATFREIKDSANLALTAAFRVEVALREGRLGQAHALGQSVEFDLVPPNWLFYVPQLTPIRLLLAEKSPASLHEARARLEVLDENMREANRNNVRIDVLALQALVCDAQGDEQTAHEKLTAALDLGIVGGNIRSFADLGPPMADLLSRLHEQGTAEMDAYISRILAAFQMEKSDTTAPDLKHLLTERELQTLRLLATDLSPQDVASEMIVSPATVRTHTRNIYQKLEVHSRFEAVQRAKELGLL